MTGHDHRPVQLSKYSSSNLFVVDGDISDENAIKASIAKAYAHHGPIHILVANAGITNESSSCPIWQMPVDLWDKTYATNVKGTFLTIKHFLQCAEAHQIQTGAELPNLSIVITGSECGKFGQAGHVEYASGKAGLQYGLIRTVKNEIVRLNSKARINAVAPGWVDTPLIEGRLDDPKELWVEAQATVSLRKIAKPEHVAKTMAFLASHKAAGHISGECISVDGGMEGRIVWGPEESGGIGTSLAPTTSSKSVPVSRVPSIKRKIQILLSVDFDAVSGWLGTGAHPDNCIADFSSGFFAGQVGVPRLLKLFKKHKIADSVTWFIPGHSLESFPKETKAIVDSGAEIGCHGYAHEGSTQMTEEQEKDMIVHCTKLLEGLTGKKPRGWRAPLYQLREHTVQVLEELGFLYGMLSSQTYHLLFENWLRHSRLISDPSRLTTILPTIRTTTPTYQLLPKHQSIRMDASTPSTICRHGQNSGRAALQLVHGRHDAHAILAAHAQLPRLCLGARHRSHVEGSL